MRIRTQNDHALNPDGAYVLYWMIAARRTRFNFALQRAAELARERRKPLIILEPLQIDYPHASDRLHTFIVEGMQANARATASTSAAYYPYVEPQAGAARGLLRAAAGAAVAVITDWHPGFMFPRLLASAARQVGVRLEAVDSNGLIPVAVHARAYPTARGYRAFVQRTLREHLGAFPVERPLAVLSIGRIALPSHLTDRWPPADLSCSARATAASLPIDHAVGPVASPGGADAAEHALKVFLAEKLPRYGAESNDPDADCTSRLSSYLHFGHISAHEVFSAVMTAERWTTRKLRPVRAGARTGWWGTSSAAEHFLEQLVVWRELAFNGCAWTPDFASYRTLPQWARATLERHREDPRSHLYEVEQLEAAETDDDLWNAAQRQLREAGWCHGYMRMLWGKKILEWCRDPAEALDRMEYLMNRYSLDGRDPVSYLNFGWVLGRYDRPWPERPVFGTVRCMTSDSARRKLKVKRYLERYSDTPAETTATLS